MKSLLPDDNTAKITPTFTLHYVIQLTGVAQKQHQPTFGCWECHNNIQHRCSLLGQLSPVWMFSSLAAKFICLHVLDLEHFKFQVACFFCPPFTLRHYGFILTNIEDWRIKFSLFNLLQSRLWQALPELPPGEEQEEQLGLELIGYYAKPGPDPIQCLPYAGFY